MSHRKKPWQSIILILAIIIATLGDLPKSALAQAATTIESDDARVGRVGVWTSQATSAASGGKYLYSSGSKNDVLSLAFAGPSIEVIYLAGPSLGTLAIEVDGTVLRTVIATDSTTRYQQSTRINYLTTGNHTLRVYAQKGGVIAVDAFVIPPYSPANVQTTAAVSDGGVQGGPFCTADPSEVTDRVSEANNGTTQTNGTSFISTVSADGRYVIYETDATNMVAGDTNGVRDVIRHDRWTCTNVMVSLSDGEAIGNGVSQTTRMTPDGNFVIFNSLATNLVSGDTNATNDVFMRDITVGTTVRVSVGAGGAQANFNSSVGDISANARFVVFQSNATNLVTGDTNGVTDIFVRDLRLGTTTRISVSQSGVEGNNFSNSPSISADGRYVVFTSQATNLVSGDTNGLQDIFLVDLLGLTPIRRISIGTGGTQMAGAGADNPVISADGKSIAYRSAATNLVSGDTNGVEDIFLFDVQNATTTTRVSVSSSGAQANFASSGNLGLSADGRFITFGSDASNLVTSDTNASSDIFVRDRLTNTTTRVNLTNLGGQSNANSFSPGISTNGRYIVYQSGANNLIAGDTNGFQDIFVSPNLALLGSDTLAVFNPTFAGVQVVSRLTNPPPASANNVYTFNNVPITGQWVMGDWDGDGDDTPGVYGNGPFFYTNDSGQNPTWSSLWIGIAGQPVSGRFNASFDNDCIGAVQTAFLGGFTVFVLYFACELSGNAVPPIGSQWLSAVLPDSGGFTGAHQFAAGDFNGDGLDSIAVRRGTFIAFGNVAPSVGNAAFDLAQFIGTPSNNDAGSFVVGDWDGNKIDSFGLYYQNGLFVYRNNIDFNNPVDVQQQITPLIGNTGLTPHARR